MAAISSAGLSAAPERIVSLGGAITETVYALGAGDQLVARDTSSVFPPAAHALPDVGYFRTIGAEGVLAQKPTLILAAQGTGPSPQVDILKHTGVKFVHLDSRPSAETVLVNLTKLAAALPFILPAAILIPRHARALNALLLGEAEAGHLGVDLARLKRALIFATAAGVGAAVSIAGGIGFIGLVVPHLTRQLFGPDHRWLVPGSALLGATLLLTADLVARTIAIPAELPVGILTAALGAPVFFSLLQRGRRNRLF